MSKRDSKAPQCPVCGRFTKQWIRSRNIWNCGHCHILYYGSDLDISNLT